MEVEVIDCDVRVNIKHPTRTLSLQDCLDIPPSIRQQWCSQLIALHQERQPSTETIRPWNIILNKDGTLESMPSPHPLLKSESERHYVYPAHFRIPPASIEDLPLKDRIQRAENFAIGSLLYQIRSSKLPFSDLSASEEEIQLHFLAADIPQDLTTLPSWPIILCCWIPPSSLLPPPSSLLPPPSSLLPPPSSLLPPPSCPSQTTTLTLLRTGTKKGTNRLLNYVKSHPYLTALQASGLLISATALGAPTLLGAAGFGALGPVANSAAAAWQSSQGIVQAGSLFSWLQSAAMGGAAAGSIASAGLWGGGAVVGATAFGLVSDWKLGENETRELVVRYREVFRRGRDGGKGDGGARSEERGENLG
ncbi:MAG: hypothetical protein M1836_005027 [Candelina mexicana]|nr:MAG: hypothetical protein M1836_005027 [Candelina mexicana]